jgi:hypothetical protein
MTEGAIQPVTVNGSTLTTDDWWNDPDVDEVGGADLLRDAALTDAVGVPFRAFKAIWRDGIQRKNVKYRDDYVSLEFQIAPARVILSGLSRIQARRTSYKVPELTAEQLASLPGESLVLNDGSTGLYRQVLQYAVAKSLVTLPEGPEEGEKGESILDLPRSEWLTGADEATKGFDIKLNCPRGLRFSEYPSEYLPEGELAKTWYIA